MGISQREVDELYSKFDTDNDENISFSEFKKFQAIKKRSKKFLARQTL